MLKLRDIMTSDVMTVTPETTLREAMELLAGRHVSGAPVVSGGQLVGIVTATDLMSFASALSGVPTERDVHDGWGEFAEPSIDDEVEQENEPGSASYTELWADAGAETTARMDNIGGPEWNVLEEHDVSEVMTRAPLASLPPNASAESAAELMRTQGIHRVLVAEDGKLLGIVSAMDIAKAAADHKFTNRTYVFDRGV